MVGFSFSWHPDFQSREPPTVVNACFGLQPEPQFTCRSAEPPPPQKDPWVVTGKSLDSPEKGNVDKMSEKCRKIFRKMSKNCLEGLKTQFSDIFGAICAYLVDAFVW